MLNAEPVLVLPKLVTSTLWLESGDDFPCVFRWSLCSGCLPVLVLVPALGPDLLVVQVYRLQVWWPLLVLNVGPLRLQS